MTLPNWENKTILVVDDDKISIEFLVELLSPSKVNIIVAQDGQRAVELCKENLNIELVLMDIRLPRMNGNEAMLEIKKERPKLPVIAQTAFAMAGDEEKYIESGFFDYISKPIVTNILVSKITNCFENFSS